MRHRLLVPALALLLVSCQPGEGQPTTTPVTSGTTGPTTTGPTTTTTTTAPPLALTLDDVKAATVSVEWWGRDASGALVPTGAGGTGAIVSYDGLILTNAHVGAPTSPGLSVLYGLASMPSTPPEALVIGVVTAEDLPPEPTYIAEPIVVEGWLDIAVLRIVSELNGQPVARLDLPTVVLGDSDTLSGGDQLTVLGFPGVGGDTLSTTRGIVSGFLPDDKLDVRRGWVKTDTPINPGNSGGLAVDENNLLVGIPTRGSDQIDQLRPINLAKPLINDALAGLRYVHHTGVVTGTGDEELTFTRWGLGLEDSGECVINPVDGYQYGTSFLLAEFSYQGFENGEDVQWVWFADDDFWYEGRLKLDQGWTGGDHGDCFWIPGAEMDDQPLAVGTYDLFVLAGADPHVVGQASVEVTEGAVPTDLVQASGRVVDLDSSQPIAEATVVLLLPGTDLATWLDDPTAEEIASAGATGTGGEDFVFSDLLQRGVRYPVVVVADGYQVLADCCVEVPDDADDQILITFQLVRSGG